MTLSRRIAAPALLIAVTASLAPGCSGSSGGWTAPKIVRVESKQPVSSLLPSWLNWASAAPEGQTHALLLRDGDFVFAFESDSTFRYRASDGPSIAVEAEKWTSRLNQKTVTVSLGEEDGRAWLSKATENQLKELRMVGVPHDVDADMLTSLRRLASVNPSVDLMFESDSGVLEVLPIFKPRYVFLQGDSKAATLASLANQPQLETLMTGSDEPGGLEVLAKLPRLTHLVLGDWDPAKTGPLPAGMKSLRSLVIAGGNVKDLSGLKNLPASLDELSVTGTKTLTDITDLARFTQLSTLILNGDEGVGDLSGLSTQKSLRWVGVPAKTTQEELSAFVAAHDNLAILDLVGNKNISSLTPLSSLKNIEALILQGPYENMSAIHGLKTLKYVGVSDKIWDDSPDQVAALKAALPDALVVRISPFCLGSGWILLLVPALALAWLVQRRTRRRIAA